MTVYHIDRYYDENDRIQFCACPYNLKGTLRLYFTTSYYPWHLRIIKLFMWLKRARFSEKKAQVLCEKAMKGEVGFI